MQIQCSNMQEVVLMSLLSCFVYFSTDSSDLALYVALQLYEKGGQLSLLSTEEYKEHIRDIPQYYQLTRKDLANMPCEIKEADLVNGHLSAK